MLKELLKIQIESIKTMAVFSHATVKNVTCANGYSILSIVEFEFLLRL
jgi:hypothetical protein